MSPSKDAAVAAVTSDHDGDCMAAATPNPDRGRHTAPTGRLTHGLYVFLSNSLSVGERPREQTQRDMVGVHCGIETESGLTQREVGG